MREEDVEVGGTYGYMDYGSYGKPKVLIEVEVIDRKEINGRVMFDCRVIGKRGGRNTHPFLGAWAKDLLDSGQVAALHDKKAMAQMRAQLASERMLALGLKDSATGGFHLRGGKARPSFTLTLPALEALLALIPEQEAERPDGSALEDLLG